MHVPMYDASSQPDRTARLAGRSVSMHAVEQHHEKINPVHELARLGLTEAEKTWGSQERKTSHLCARVVENPSAALGEVFRFEIYLDPFQPDRYFSIQYRRQQDPHGNEVITNQFSTNDKAYAERHGWLQAAESASSRSLHVVAATEETFHENLMRLYERRD